VKGDADCDGDADTVDVLWILWYDGRLVAAVPCEENAKVSADQAVNSLDALLVLQTSAGLARL
jgi:hypothetical protein